jgi:hypothetical protein
MEFKSSELKDAAFSPSSLTYKEKTPINIEELRSSLRSFILEKDNTLLDVYDISCFNRKRSDSALENLEFLFDLFRRHFIEKFSNDRERLLLIELMFNNVISNFKALKIINTDFESKEINAIILGFLIKNFI